MGDDEYQDQDSRVAAFKAEIERRLASGPATPLDFSELKRSIRREVEARRTGARESMFDRLNERTSALS